MGVLMCFIVCSANMQLEVGLSFWMQDASTPELEFCWLNAHVMPETMVVRVMLEWYSETV
jgi:hypothetical protein